MVSGAHDPVISQLFDPLLVTRTFRTAFRSVWEPLPRADRYQVLRYWQRGLVARLTVLRQSKGQPSPIIRVSADRLPDVEFAALGMEITFPAWLVAEEPQRLHGEIARILAQVYRLATEEHWGLVVEMIQEPMRHWERQEGISATDEQRKSKMDILEQESLGAFRASFEYLLRTWGFDALSYMAHGNL
jgi:hypothetical protein